MPTIDAFADSMFDVVARLAARDTERVGAPFLRFNVIDMERELQVETGPPVRADAVIEAEEPVFVGVFQPIAI